jgi:hypothetical protein
MTLSIAVVMGIIVVLLVAKFELKWFHALICVMAGLSLNGTKVGDFISGMLVGTVHALSQIRF